MTDLRLIDLKRNNIPQALQYFEEHARDGTLKETDTRSLYLLQDSPDELVELLEALVDDLRAEGIEAEI